MFDNIKADLQAALDRDPAAKSKIEIFLTYGGFNALMYYRLAHWLYNHKCGALARLVSMKARRHTGIDIHPAAKIGKGMFIDHGVGLVIGETTEIGENVTLYQGVTLGGTGKDVGKRHPTLGNNVMVSAGAKILGPVVIGENSKIGAGSVVLKDVPPNCTVVGVPGRVVRMRGQKYKDMDQKLPDPVLDEFSRINHRLAYLEENAGLHTCKYSITTAEDGEIEDDKTDKNNGEK